MAKVVYVVVNNQICKPEVIGIDILVTKKIISAYRGDDTSIIIARYGTNKSTLKKLLAKELKNG